VLIPIHILNIKFLVFVRHDLSMTFCPRNVQGFVMPEHFYEYYGITDETVHEL
jgi:hypothetical protein